MIAIDSSAVVAILHEEPECQSFSECILQAGGAVVSAASIVELAAVTAGKKLASRGLDEFLLFPFVQIEPVDLEQALIGAEAYRRFGRGHHPARLNLGDTFAYALARRKDLPLLFKGDDFAKTDIEPAMPLERRTD